MVWRPPTIIKGCALPTFAATLVIYFFLMKRAETELKTPVDKFNHLRKIAQDTHQVINDIAHSADKEAFQPTTVAGDQTTVDLHRHRNDRVVSNSSIFIKNPVSLCKQGVVYIIYVHSAPDHFKKRQTIRDTWGNYRILNEFRARLVFVLGVTYDANITDRIDMEFSQFRDIVQTDFLDTYRNLTNKAIASLKWVVHFCPGAKVVIKTDDDIFVNIYQLMDRLSNNADNQKTTPTNQDHESTGNFLCNRWIKMKVVRDKRSKWYISENELPNLKYFKPYCSGSAFVFSTKLARNLYSKSLSTDFFWVDDYYLTGILAEELGITQTRLNEAYVLNPSVAVKKFTDDLSSTNQKLLFFHVHKLTSMYLMWRALQEQYSKDYQSDGDVMNFLLERRHRQRRSS